MRSGQWSPLLQAQVLFIPCAQNFLPEHDLDWEWVFIVASGSARCLMIRGIFTRVCAYFHVAVGDVLVVLVLCY